jgi:hypothetical protein
LELSRRAPIDQETWFRHATGGLARRWHAICMDRSTGRFAEMGFEYGGGIIGIIILILDIWAIVRVLQSTASTIAKLIWIIVIIVLPVIGLLIWLLAGPK